MIDLSVLGPNDICGTELVFQCPNNCGKKLYINIQKQMYFCQVCGNLSDNPNKFKGKGSFITLAKYLKQDINPEEKTTYTPTYQDYLSPDTFKAYTDLFTSVNKLTESHQEYVSNRGFIHNEIQAMSSDIAWNHLTTYKLQKYILDTKSNLSYRPSWLTSGKLLIPYFQNDIVVGIRARSMNPLPTVKYIWAKHNKAADKIFNINLLQNNKIIIWTEGEFKAAYATLKGLPTIATPGVAIGHENLMYYLCRHKTQFVYVCFDTEIKNSTSEKNVQAAYNNASKMLTKYSIPYKRIYLPSESGKIDLDDFILKYEINATQELFPLLKHT